MIHSSDAQKKNEHELWTNIRNGEKDSLSSLFSLYYPCLFNYGYKIVSRDQFIKDCIQELFVTIWEQRTTISEVYSVKSYLYVSMRRMIFTNLKKQRNYQKRNKKYAEEFHEDTPDFESWIVSKECQMECRDKLYEAMQALSNRQQEIIKLKFSDGLSNSEIAGLLEIQRQSVYNHVSEAIKQLKNYVHNTPQTTAVKSPIYAATGTYS